MFNRKRISGHKYMMKHTYETEATTQEQNVEYEKANLKIPRKTSIHSINKHLTCSQ